MSECRHCSKGAYQKNHFANFLAPATQITVPNVTISIVQFTVS